MAFPFEYIDGGDHVILQRLATDGRPLWATEGVPVIDLASAPGKVWEGPVLGSVDDGVLRVVWEHSTIGDPTRSEIRFSAVDAAGNRLTPSDGVPLLRRTLAPSYTLIRGFAFDPASGSSFVVWESDRGAAAVLYTP